MNEFLASTLSALLGVLIGAWISIRANVKAQRAAFTFDFHREFNSSEMGKHRAKADKLIIKNPSLNFIELGKIADNEWCDSLYLVMRYYQRLWLGIKYKHVNEKLALEMFRNNFYFWYYVSFEENVLCLDWAGAPHMRALAQWFYENTEHDTHLQLRDKYRSQLAERKSEASKGDYIP